MTGDILSVYSDGQFRFQKLELILFLIEDGLQAYGYFL